MSDLNPPAPGPTGSTRARLAELAALVRDADHLEPDERDRLAGLVAELDDVLHGQGGPAVAEHVAASAEELIHALRDRQDRDRLATVGARLRDRTTTIEAKETSGSYGPALAMLLDVLSELGI